MPHAKPVILIPTYNERESIALLVPEIFALYPDVFITVIDDSSPDGTAAVVRELMRRYPHLSLLSRPAKRGLGAAYTQGIIETLADPEVTRIVLMDADGSHAAQYLGAMLAHPEYGLVVGSRYTKGGGIDEWEISRRLLSYGGNLYARLIAGVPIRDMTAGFMSIDADLLRRIDFSRFRASGYSFLMELKYQCTRVLGARVLEVPIIFMLRRGGQSKLTRQIILEGLATPWRLRAREAWAEQALAILRYLTAGCVVAAVNLGILYLATEYGHIFYLYSSVLAFFVALSVSFTLQKFWTFRNRVTTGIHRQALWYALIQICNLACNTLLLYLFVEYLHIWYLFSAIIVTGLLAAVTFFLFSRLFREGSQVKALAAFPLAPAVLAFVVGALALGGLWASGALTHAVYPVLIDDDIYYLARMEAVAHGYPAIGNPYYLEHRFDTAPAFTLPDRIAAVPLQLGAGIPLTLLVNFLLWSEVVVLLAYAVLRRCALSTWAAAAGALFIYAGTYDMVMRPVILELILPVFAAFVLGLLWLGQAGRRSWFGVALVAASTAVSFYFYGYLWQIIGATLVAVLLWHLLRGERSLSAKVLIAGCAGLILAVPEVLTLIHQFNDPMYLQTMGRIRLIESHWPTMAQYYYGRWVLVTMLAWYLMRRAVAVDARVDTLIYGLGAGLLVANWSNIFTGKEMQIGEHIGYFITWYAALAGVLFVHALTTKRFSCLRRLVSREHLGAKAGALILLLALASFLASNLERSAPWGAMLADRSARYEQMSGALAWLAAQPQKNQVVLADDLLAAYIPVYTGDYDLFAQSGQLHMMSDAEVTDRYLLSRAVRKTLTVGQLAEEMDLHGAAVQHLEYANTENAWCARYRLDILFGMWCAPQQDMVAYEGAAYWQGLLDAWHADKTHLAQKLAQYQVRYVAWPKARLADIDIRTLALTKAYEDQYYVVYAIAQPR